MSAQLPITPDVLAFHVCPFLRNRDRANMLQLCRGVRRDLVAKKVAGLVQYRVSSFQVDSRPGGDVYDSDILIPYMQKHGTQRLTFVSYSYSMIPKVHKLDKLRELRIEYIDVSVPYIYSMDMPASLEIVYIQHFHCNPNYITINLDHLLNLRSLEIYGAASNVALMAAAPPQCLAKLTVHTRVLNITRTDAANIMLGPKFTHFDIYTTSLYNINGIFNGLDAPMLQSFASRGLDAPHRYDLRAPQLRTLTHQGMSSCMPESASKTITHLHTMSYNSIIYSHLSNVTHLQIDTTGKYQFYTTIRTYLVKYLPPLLEELTIFGKQCTMHLECAVPKTLKVIKLLNGCLLYDMPRTYTGAVVVEP
jgi:hypothetical protein